MAARSVKNLQELECPVCMDTLKNPKILSCFHAFCEECLKQHYKTSEVGTGKLKCLKCRKVTALSGEGVAGLKSNPLICRLLEVLEAKKNSSQIMCTACGDSDSPLTTYCRDCLHFICDSCASYHGKMKLLLKDHRTVPLDKIANGTIKIKWMEEGFWGKVYECEEHSSELRRFYCRTCKRRICRDCIVLDHTKPDHDCTTVQKMFQEIQEEMKDLLKSCNEKEENVCTMINDVKVKETAANRKFQAMKKSVQDLKVTAVASLNKAEEEILVKIETLEDKLNHKIKALKDNMETTKDNLTRLQSRAKDVISAKGVTDISKASFFPEDVLQEFQELIASEVTMTISTDLRALKGTMVQGQKSVHMTPFAKLSLPRIWQETQMHPPPDKDVVNIFCDGTSVYVACKQGIYKTKLSHSVDPSPWLKLHHDNSNIKQVVDMAISMEDKTFFFIAETNAASTQLYRFRLDDFSPSQQSANPSYRSSLSTTSPCPLNSFARITVDFLSRVVVANNQPSIPSKPEDSIKGVAVVDCGFSFLPQQQRVFTGPTKSSNTASAFDSSKMSSPSKTERVPSPSASKEKEVKTESNPLGSCVFTLSTTIYRGKPDRISTPSMQISSSFSSPNVFGLRALYMHGAPVSTVQGPQLSSDNFKVPFHRARNLVATKFGKLVFLRWDKKAIIITDKDGRVQHEIKEPGRMYLSISCTESNALYVLSAFWGSHTVTLTKHSLTDGSLLEDVIDELDLSGTFQSDKWPVIGNHGNDLVIMYTGNEIRVYSAEDWDILHDHQSDSIKSEDEDKVGMETCLVQ